MINLTGEHAAGPKLKFFLFATPSMVEGAIQEPRMFVLPRDRSGAIRGVRDACIARWARTAAWKDAVHILSGSQPREVQEGADIDGVVNPVPRFGSTGGNVAGTEIALPSTESASLLTLPRGRLTFRYGERKFVTPRRRLVSADGSAIAGGWPRTRGFAPYQRPQRAHFYQPWEVR